MTGPYTHPVFVGPGSGSERTIYGPRGSVVTLKAGVYPVDLVADALTAIINSAPAGQPIEATLQRLAEGKGA